MCLLLSLMLLWHLQVDGANYTDLCPDLQEKIVSNIGDSDRFVSVRLLDTKHQRFITDCYNKEIDDIKSILLNSKLTNKNALNYSAEIRERFIHRNNLYFGAIFDKELPQILRSFNAKNLSSNQVKLLLYDMNKSQWNRVDCWPWYERNFPSFDPFILESASYTLLHHYFELDDTSKFSNKCAPLLHLMASIFYKTVAKNRKLLTRNTILWDVQTIDSIPYEISQKYSKTYYFSQCAFEYLSKEVFWQKFNMTGYEVWTEYILTVSDMDNNPNSTLAFSLQQNSDDCLDWDCKAWIRRIAQLADYQYNLNNMDKFDRLIHALATTFFARNCIEIVSNIKPNLVMNKVAINKLVGMRSDWNRQSLMDMIGHCKFAIFWFISTILMTAIIPAIFICLVILTIIMRTKTKTVIAMFICLAIVVSFWLILCLPLFIIPPFA